MPSIQSPPTRVSSARAAIRRAALSRRCKGVSTGSGTPACGRGSGLPCSLVSEAMRAIYG